MSPEINDQELVEEVKEVHPIFKVTKTAKYLALALFVVMPLLVAWIGYTYAPEIEVKDVVNEAIENNAIEDEIISESQTNFKDLELGYAFSYPAKWGTAMVAYESGESVSNSPSYRLIFGDLSPGAPGLAMLAGSRSLTIDPLGRGVSFGDLFAKNTDMSTTCRESSGCSSFVNSRGTTIWQFIDYSYGSDSRADFYVFDPENGYFGPVIISNARLQNVAEIEKDTFFEIIDSIEVYSGREQISTENDAAAGEMAITEESITKIPFSISNVKVTEAVLQIDGGDAQTLDNEFLITWTYSQNELAKPSNALILFSIVDSSGKVISPGLRGAGTPGTYLNGSTTLKTPPLCSVSAAESCIEDTDYNANEQYRLRVSGLDCKNLERNPGYCDEDDSQRIEPTYSNWFRLAV
jgi:hypothetical protein